MNTKETPEELATKLKEIVARMADLLGQIPHADLTMAMTEGGARDSMDRLMETRKKWVTVFHALADDMEIQFAHVRQNRDETIEGLKLIKGYLRDMCEMDIRKTNVEIARFLLMAKEFRALKQDGTLDLIAKTLKQHEISAS